MQSIDREVLPGSIVKVGLTGAGCVGKSSVYDRLSILMGASFIGSPEAARDFFKHEYNEEMGGRYSAEVQARIQARARAHELEARVRAGRLTRLLGRAVVVTDQTLFAAPVCVWATGDRDGALRLMDQAEAWAADDPYDRIYLLNPEGVPFVNDAERKESADDRQRFHDAYLALFAGRGIEHTLLSGNVADRTDTVITGIHTLWRPDSSGER